MGHAWKPYAPPDKTPVELFMSEPYRRCEHCGKVQQRETEHAWMRVVGHKWRPLAGACTHRNAAKPANAGPSQEG
jgi:hypothetical protein